VRGAWPTDALAWLRLRRFMLFRDEEILGVLKDE
jgi:hypothetical protein